MTVARGQLLIDQYKHTFEGDDTLMLQQLIGDLLEWCDGKGVDFQLTVQEAQQMLRECGN